MSNNTILLDLIAKGLNAGGSALVTAYDGSAKLFNVTMTALSPGEKTKLQSRIKKLENSVKQFCQDVAKESAKYADPALALESEPVKAILAKTNEYQQEIQLMKQRVAEILASKAEMRAAKKKPAKAKPEPKATGECSCKFDLNSLLVKFMPGENATLERRILETEKKITGLYTEIAKESAKLPDPESALESEPVKKLTAEIRELKADIDNMKRRIVEIGEEKKTAEAKKKEQKELQSKAKQEKKKEQQELKAKAKEVKKAGKTPEPAADVTVDVRPGADEVTGAAIETESGAEYDRAKRAAVPRPTLVPPTSGPQYPTAAEEEAARAEKMRKILESYQTAPDEQVIDTPVEAATEPESPAVEAVAAEAPVEDEIKEPVAEAAVEVAAEPETPVVAEVVEEVPPAPVEVAEPVAEAAVEVSAEPETPEVKEVATPPVPFEVAAEPVAESPAKAADSDVAKIYEADLSQHSSMFRTKTFSSAASPVPPVANFRSTADVAAFRQKGLGSAGLQFSAGSNPAMTMHHDDSGIRTRTLAARSLASESATETPSSNTEKSSEQISQPPAAVPSIRVKAQEKKKNLKQKEFKAPEKKKQSAKNNAKAPVKKTPDTKAFSKGKGTVIKPKGGKKTS